MARGHELLIAQIAIAKTGAAWLPFDADAPVERIAVCLADAEAKGLLTSAGLRAPRRRGDVAVSRSDSTADLVDARTRPGRSRARSARRRIIPAYLIYTSGSTGTPKGIVDHGPQHLPLSARRQRDLRRRRDSDVVFQGASVAFDLSMEEIWIPYLVGATLFVATPRDHGRDGATARRFWKRSGVTVLDTVPTLLAVLPRDVATLRHDHSRRRGLPAGGRRRAGAGRAARSSTPTVRPRRPSSRPSPKCGRASRSRSAGRSRITAAMSSTSG